MHNINGAWLVDQLQLLPRNYNHVITGECVHWALPCRLVAFSNESLINGDKINPELIKNIYKGVGECAF